MAGAERPDRPARLADRLRAAAGPAGFLPFDRVADLALYDPEVGYYESPRPPLGPSGDFYTAAHASRLFGRTLARRALLEFERLGRPRVFRVVELGPGDGRLAREIVASLAAALPAEVELDYVLVERSSALAAAASAALAPLEKPGRVRVRAAGSAGEDGPFTGLLLANELLDAVPFRRLIARGGAWRELGVRVGTDPPAWAEGPMRPLPGPPLPAPPRDGVVLEVSPFAEAILREVGDHLAHGSALFLDYGLEEPELLLGHPEGTLSALRAHRVVADPLRELGRADLSAFVNFTRLRAAAERAGLVESMYVGQAEALLRWGLPELLESEARSAGSSEAEVRLRLGAKNLLFGFGTFRVLELRPAGDPGAPTPSPEAPPGGPAPPPSPR